ncbi:MAG: hypothetical protein MMC33_002133 [Icmadophila ericetorum]|nr:hypothetical protein [Icmadophila ericetorum]
MHDYPDFDIIDGGRAYDPAPHAAFCIYSGLENLRIAYHKRKIMECGALCAKPQSAEVLVTARKDSFDLMPLNPMGRCTASSVAAHTLYEKSRPDILLGPGRALVATYEELPDNCTVRVRVSTFMPFPGYTIKLEGARVNGHRSVFFSGVRDPILISQVDSVLPRTKAYVKS